MTTYTWLFFNKRDALDVLHDFLKSISKGLGLDVNDSVAILIFPIELSTHAEHLAWSVNISSRHQHPRRVAHIFVKLVDLVFGALRQLVVVDRACT
jgi:hypothetical protein